MNARMLWCPILTASLLLAGCGDTSDASPGSDAGPEADAEGPSAQQLRTQVVASLNTFVGLQQEHYRQHGAYTTDLDALGYEGNPAVQIEVREADDSGWSVVLGHDALEGWSCAAFTGEVDAVPTTAGGITPEAGRSACDPLPGSEGGG